MSRTVRVFVTMVVAVAFTVNVAWGIVVVSPPDLNPLNQTVVPEPPNLSLYVKNKQVAIQLGKAFFWDMQVGSDGIQACATCHFSFGVDNRMKNTLNPGTRAGDATFQVVGPNETLLPSHFPFHKRESPDDLQSSPVIRDSNDVVGSQGVRKSRFLGINPGSAVDITESVPDPIFNVGGQNVRQVTARNTPSIVNAIFNFTNFWDGRASFIFNGENPFGLAAQDGQNPTAAAGVWLNEGGTLVKRPVTLLFASLASQATGPALDDVEMSAAGRTFPMLGRKLLSLTPLGKQYVSHDDSVLGGLANSASTAGAKGLHLGYEQLIKDAFRDNLWNSTLLTPDRFTQMEANFAFFWGLSIQLYVATLVSDQTPFDYWLAGVDTALTDQQKFGFALFSGIGACMDCHMGIELTSASVTNAFFVNDFDHNLVDLMPVSDGNQTIYDTGFNNTAVTRTTDDIGRGGDAPFTNPLTGQPYPLSFVELAELQAQGLLPFQAPILPLFLPVDFPITTAGSFKVPGLRNVELTAPFFHNGSVMDLESVVDFYVRGGNFPLENIADLDPAVGAGLILLQGKEDMHNSIAAFLKSLTDERVRNHSAPFDHPEILIPEGDPEVLIRIPARDSNGVQVIPVLSLNPVITPTNETSQTISGTVQAGLTPEVTVNTTATVGLVTVSGADWSVEISGLSEGANLITVSVLDGDVQTVLTTTITFDPTPPPPPDTITVTLAKFTSRTGKWSIKGKTSAPGSTLSFRVGADFTGPSIGTAVANPRGKFKLLVKKSTTLPDATNTFSLQSSNGTLVLDLPLKVK